MEPCWTAGRNFSVKIFLRGPRGSTGHRRRSSAAVEAEARRQRAAADGAERLVVVAAGFETAWWYRWYFGKKTTPTKNTQTHTDNKNTFKKIKEGCVFFWCIGLFSCLKGRFGTWNKSSQTWRRVLTNIMSAPYLLPPLLAWHFARWTFFLQIKEWTKKAEWSYLELLN